MLVLLGRVKAESFVFLKVTSSNGLVLLIRDIVRLHSLPYGLVTSRERTYKVGRKEEAGDEVALGMHCDLANGKDENNLKG